MADLKQSAKAEHCTSEQILLFNRIKIAFQNSYERFQTYSQKEPDIDQLSTVLTELEKKTNFDERKANEQEDIASAVTELITNILNEMGSYDEDCLELQLLTAGGYFDGTKICFPDEFDFLVDICALSEYFATKSEEEISLDHWSGDSTRVNVRIVGEISPSVSRFFPKDEKSVTESDIQKDGPTGKIMNTQFANVFASLFKEVMVSFIESNFSVTRPTGTLVIMTGLEEELYMPFNSSFLQVYVLWIPNSQESKPLGISVDVTPSFRLPSGYMKFNKVYFNTHAYERLAEIIGKDNCYFRLVLRDEENWRISLSHVETELIRQEDPIHKTCHRILKLLKEGTLLEVQEGQQPDAKYMEKKARSCKFTEMCTSYAVKSVVMSHIMSCKEHSRNLGGCFIAMLLQLQKVIVAGTFVKPVIGIDKEESSCTENWETETMMFLTSLNDIIMSSTENRSLTVNSVVQSILSAKQKHIQDIATSESYQEIDEWYITGT